MTPDRATPIRLSGLVLPKDGAHGRTHLLPPDARTQDYLARYDRHTLFYDCVRRDGQDGVLFIAPPFLNLWPLFRDGLRQNGAPVANLRRKTYPKYDAVFLRGVRGPLHLELDGQSYPITPRAPLAGRFAGLNAVMTMNHNNRIEWILDWLRFHVRAHGLQAAIIHDNGSTDYNPEDLARCIAEIPGIVDSAVISAPYPYGTNLPKGSGRIIPKFLQSAMMNLARLETLSRARAVLNADIDELIVPRSGRSVFDVAVRRRFTPVKIAGQYAFPDAVPTGGIGHTAHVLRALPPRRANRKWCATPSGGFSRLGWYVHQTGGELWKLLRHHPDFYLVHCSATTTNWKNGPRYRLPDVRVHDLELERVMKTYLDAQL